MTFTFHTATHTDLPAIRTFVDFWLSGRGMTHHVPGAVNDYFITPSQHSKYISKYTTTLILQNNTIIGWAVQQPDLSLIHLLISAPHRRNGLGSKFLQHLQPPSIHSKSNQSSGDPAPFYAKNGYSLSHIQRPAPRLNQKPTAPTKPKTIAIYTKQ